MVNLRSLAGLAASLAFCVAHAQSAGKNDEILRYKGADRETRLIERAKQEGAVVVYTSLAPSESKPLAEAFEKKYGVKVDLWRALSDKVVQRTITEAQARKNTVDVIETNGPEMEMLAREKVLAEFHSPLSRRSSRRGDSRASNLVSRPMNFFVVAFNTAKVSRARFPRPTKGSSIRNGRGASESRRPTPNGWRPW
jgi:iron(III) transport system substrate-binding protein